MSIDTKKLSMLKKHKIFKPTLLYTQQFQKRFLLVEIFILKHTAETQIIKKNNRNRMMSF